MLSDIQMQLSQKGQYETCGNGNCNFAYQVWLISFSKASPQLVGRSYSDLSAILPSPAPGGEGGGCPQTVFMAFEIEV